MAARVLTVALVALGVSCAAASPHARVGTLPAAWQRVRDDGGSVAFHHAAGGTIVSAISCGDGDDVPLDVLTNHLLLGIEGRRERARERLVLDGRAALRTQLDAQLDGVPVTLDLVVLKKDGCTVDLYLVAPRPAFDERRADFVRFLGASVDVSRR
jgi:hypothetical protein